MIVTLVIIFTTGCLCKDLINKEGADRIRQRGATWEIVDPDESIFKNLTLEEFSNKFQRDWPTDFSLPELNEAKLRKNSRLLQALPEEFDARKEWGSCIHLGKDQGECRGCWAFGVVDHLTDRFCIAGQDVVLSVQDMLECATGNKCCDGGSAENAYNYMMKTGIVNEDCKEFDGNCDECRPNSCKRFKCMQNSAWLTNKTEIAKWEIMTNGPITGIYDLYEDFAYYKGGVYYHTTEKKIGIHSVTLVGWGKENNIEFWICKNSWGSAWGDDGYFKIKIGDSGIDSYMTSCMPLLEP